MQRYYCPQWDKSEVFLLPEQESRHCIDVMRNQLGSRIHILDGKGNLVLAEIVYAHSKSTRLQFIETIEFEVQSNQLHIAISPTKSNDRFEWFLEKACELGVQKITPIIFSRTERSKVNLERWQKILYSSCKQAKVLWFPSVFEPMKLEHFLETNRHNDMQAAVIGSNNAVKILPNTEQIILIGPEGDYSEKELELIRNYHIRDISLSKNILRVETAGIAAICLWNVGLS